MRSWGEVHDNQDDGSKWQMFLHFGAVAGLVEQFQENAPTTYAQAHGNRIGAFESWEAARRAVEEAVSLVKI